MGFLTSLFGSKRSSRKTTSEHHLRLQHPTIGFLNLMEESGQALLESDAKVLSPLFRRTLRSLSATSVCEVLFLYCELDPDGHIKGRTETVRDLIKSARAYIVVIASENSTDSYIKWLQRRNDWRANVTMVLDRKGDKFAQFFQKLFMGMFAGRSMLNVWVELAPQGHGPWEANVPGTIMAAEAGHITF